MLDNELSFNLENNVLRLNYDDVNKNLKSFDQNLTRLDELNEIIHVFYQEKNAKTLKVINDDFLKKQRLVDRSNYASSSMAAYILSGEFEIVSEKKLDALNVIFHAIKSSAIISPETLNQTKEQIEKYKDIYRYDTKAILVLNKATYALEFAKKLSAVAQDSVDLKLGETLRKFRDDTLASYSIMIRNIVIMQVLCFISFVLFCALAFYQARVLTKQLKQIKLLKTTVDAGHS